MSNFPGSPHPSNTYAPPPGPPPQHSGSPHPSYPVSPAGYSASQGGYPPPLGPPPSGGYPPPTGPPPGVSLYPPPSYPPPMGTPPPPAQFGSSPYSGQTQPHQGSYPPYMNAPQPTAPLHGSGAPGFMPVPDYSSHSQQQPYSISPTASPYPPSQPTSHGQSQTLTYLGVPIPPPPPAPPAEFLKSLPGFNADTVAEKAYKAMKGFGTNEKALTEAIAPLDAFQIEALKLAYLTKRGKELIKVVESEISGNYWLAMRAKLLGPIMFDCWLIKDACQGAGTNEDILNEVLLNRSNTEIQLLKSTYQAIYRKDMARVVADELSLKTKDLFMMALAGNRGTQASDGGYGDGFLDQKKVDIDVEHLYKAGEGRFGTDEIGICRILVTSGTAHLHAVIHQYELKHGKKLSVVIQKEFSGHMKEALLYIVQFYEDGGNGLVRDAKLLEASMAGIGTKDKALIRRVMRGHWDKQRFEAIKMEFNRKFGKTLMARVRGETSGDYRDFMVAVLEARPYGTHNY